MVTTTCRSSIGDTVRTACCPRTARSGSPQRHGEDGFPQTVRTAQHSGSVHLELSGRSDAWFGFKFTCVGINSLSRGNKKFQMDGSTPLGHIANTCKRSNKRPASYDSDIENCRHGSLLFLAHVKSTFTMHHQPVGTTKSRIN